MLSASRFRYQDGLRRCITQRHRGLNFPFHVLFCLSLTTFELGWLLIKGIQAFLSVQETGTPRGLFSSCNFNSWVRMEKGKPGMSYLFIHARCLIR